MMHALPANVVVSDGESEYNNSKSVDADDLLDDLPPPLEDDSFEVLNDYSLSHGVMLPDDVAAARLENAGNDVATLIEESTGQANLILPSQKRRGSRAPRPPKAAVTVTSIVTRCYSIDNFNDMTVTTDRSAKNLYRCSSKIAAPSNKTYHSGMVLTKVPLQRWSTLSPFPRNQRGLKFMSKLSLILGNKNTIDECFFLRHIARFMEQQAIFAQTRKSTKATLGYIYSNEDLNVISQKGLLSSPESLADRQFGGGTYLSHHPHAVVPRGRVGILVAYLSGSMSRVLPDGTNIKYFDTAVRNQELYDSPSCGLSPLWHDEIIPKEGSQCLPLFFYQPEKQMAEGFHDALWKKHSEIQTLLDQCFNRGVTTIPQTPVLEWDLPVVARSPSIVRITGYHTNGPTLEKNSDWDQELAYFAPTRLTAGIKPAMDPMKKVGLSPSGLMTVRFSKEVFATGSTGTFVIVYEIFGGIQEDYHISPGEMFVGLKLRMYVPFSHPGHDLLKRLKWAWMFGLMFTVIPFLSSSRTDEAAPKLRSLQTTITDGCHWESLVDACHCELHRLGVPDAGALRNGVVADS